MSVIVSTFLIFMFVDQLLLEDVLIFAADYYLTYAKKQKCRTYREVGAKNKNFGASQTDLTRVEIHLRRRLLLGSTSISFMKFDSLQR